MTIDTMAGLREVYRPARGPGRPEGSRPPRRPLPQLHRPVSVLRDELVPWADGRADASPRGDPPGSLAHIPDDKTLVLPDRPGNRQVDTLMNLVECPYVGLVFFVPGFVTENAAGSTGTRRSRPTRD